MINRIISCFVQYFYPILGENFYFNKSREKTKLKFIFNIIKNFMLIKTLCGCKNLSSNVQKIFKQLIQINSHFTSCCSHRNFNIMICRDLRGLVVTIALYFCMLENIRSLSALPPIYSCEPFSSCYNLFYIF